MPRCASALTSVLRAPEIRMTTSELAWELADLFGELDTPQINEMLAKNVPLEALEFFSAYAETFAKAQDVASATARRLPNLMLLGYLLRVLEERLLDEDEEDESAA
jgi:hypothetical protein